MVGACAVDDPLSSLRLSRAPACPHTAQGLGEPARSRYMAWTNGILSYNDGSIGAAAAVGVFVPNPPIGHFQSSIGECHCCVVQRCCQVHSSTTRKKPRGERGGSGGRVVIEDHERYARCCVELAACASFLRRLRICISHVGAAIGAYIRCSQPRRPPRPARSNGRRLLEPCATCHGERQSDSPSAAKAPRSGDADAPWEGGNREPRASLTSPVSPPLS